MGFLDTFLRRVCRHLDKCLSSTPISQGGPQNVKILGPHGAPKWGGPIFT